MKTNETNTKQCEWCRNPFEVKASQPKQRFCSQSCAQTQRRSQAPGKLPSAFWARTKIDRASPKLNGAHCRNWLGAKIEGYGVLGTLNGNTLAHRHAYQLANGAIPDGLFIIHACDNPACVEPKHLTAATPADNSADMVAKGRQYKGEKHHLAKLTSKDIPILMNLKQRGLTYKEIASLFNVSLFAVYCAVNRLTWKHVQIETQSLQ